MDRNELILELQKRFGNRLDFLENRSTANRLFFKTDENRKDLYLEIVSNLQIPKIEYLETRKLSSVGHIQIEKICIILKSSKKTKTISLNGLNEKYLVDLIFKLTSGWKNPINLKFSDGKNSLVINDTISAADSSFNTKKDKFGLSPKADVIIFTKTSQIPISIKLPTADFYASYSSDKEIAEICKKLFTSLKNDDTIISIRDNDPSKFKLNISRIGIDLDNNHGKHIIEKGMFGSDIMSCSGCIAVFDLVKNKDCKIENDYHVIESNLILKSMDDINSSIGLHYPFLSIQNHLQKRIGDIRGIECRLSTKRNIRNGKIMKLSEIEKSKIGVVFGKFQGFHKEHQSRILELSKKVRICFIVIVVKKSNLFKPEVVIDMISNSNLPDNCGILISEDGFLTRAIKTLNIWDNEDEIIFSAGEDRIEEYKKQLEKYKVPYNYSFDDFQPIRNNLISGTNFRESFLNCDIDKFISIAANGINNESYFKKLKSMIGE